MPDEQLVAAVLAGSARTMGDLDDPDRCWAVAGLSAKGLTAEDIAARLKCSLRLVRTIRAMPMTQVCLYAQVETGNFANELRLSETARKLAVAENTELREENERVRTKLARMIDAHIVGCKVCAKCGTPMDRYNTWTSPRTGETRCRKCNRERQKQFRDARKKQAPAQDVTGNPVTNLSDADLEDHDTFDLVSNPAVDDRYGLTPRR